MILRFSRKVSRADFIHSTTDWSMMNGSVHSVESWIYLLFLHLQTCCHLVAASHHQLKLWKKFSLISQIVQDHDKLRSYPMISIRPWFLLFLLDVSSIFWKDVEYLMCSNYFLCSFPVHFVIYCLGWLRFTDSPSIWSHLDASLFCKKFVLSCHLVFDMLFFVMSLSLSDLDRDDLKDTSFRATSLLNLIQ